MPHTTLRSCFAALALLPLSAAASDDVFLAQDAWFGVYQCGARTTFATLKLTAVDSPGARQSVQGSFSFGGDGGRPSGNYTLAGAYDAASRTLTLAPRGFFSLPAGYVPVGFSGRLGDAGNGGDVVLTGRIAHAGCGGLTLIRGRTVAAPPAPVPAPAPVSLLPAAAAVLTERFVHRDAGVLAALALPCPERAQVLDRLQADRRADPQRQGEELVALAGIEAGRDCQWPGGGATQRWKTSSAPAVAADQRAISSQAAFQQRLQLVAARRDWLQQMLTGAPIGPAVSQPCTEPLEAFADADAARAFEAVFDALPLWTHLWAWAWHNLGERVACTQMSDDGLSLQTRILWPEIVRQWRRAYGPAGQPTLRAADADQLLFGLRMASESKSTRDAQRASAEQQAAEAAAAERRRRDEERARPTGDRR